AARSELDSHGRLALEARQLTKAENGRDGIEQSPDARCNRRIDTASLRSKQELPLGWGEGTNRRKLLPHPGHFHFAFGKRPHGRAARFANGLVSTGQLELPEMGEAAPATVIDKQELTP